MSNSSEKDIHSCKMQAKDYISLGIYTVLFFCIVMNGVDSAFMDQLYNLINGPMIVAIVAVTFIASIMGALIAKGLLKKHFEKAGIL